MPTPLIPPALAVDWIPRLVRQLARIRGDRRAEIISISDEFHDLELLARSYIDPDCQFFNPADFDEDEPGRVLRSPIRQWVNDFLKGEFANHDGRHVVFILSDAGMGKTSLLMMLKLAHLLRFWPQGLDFQLLKLGEDTLDRVRELKNRRRIVLLLDSLDEDPRAWGRIEARLQEILRSSENFRQVFITCRTQFFPQTRHRSRAPIEQPGKVEVEGFVCNLLYLSPFNDLQVKTYLRKLYASWTSEILRWATGKESRKVGRAEKVVIPMKSLRMRPMLLAYIQDLMESELGHWGEFAVYEALVMHWLLREKRKQEPAGGLGVDDLLAVCQRLALDLHRQQRRSIPEQELEALLEGPRVDLSKLDVGGRSLLNRTSGGELRFAHYSIQEFLVAQSLLTTGRPQTALPGRATEQISSFVLSYFEHPGRPAAERLRAAENLGRAGDPRLAAGVDNFLDVPGLDGSRLGKYPVTVEEYRRFVEAGGYEERKYWSGAGWSERTAGSWQAPDEWDRQLDYGNRPVVGVSWHEAEAYCGWLGEQLGTAIALPTGAEWQQAAAPDGRVYPWGKDKPTPELANFGDNAGSPTPVGLYPAGNGPFGHSDLAGNVWEWSADPYHEEASRPGDGERDSPGVAAVRVLRGGSWADLARGLRAAFRLGRRAVVRSRYFGFRVLCRFGPEL